jgi:hypothetical protein
LLDVGRWTLDVGRWTLDDRCWILDIGDIGDIGRRLDVGCGVGCQSTVFNALYRCSIPPWDPVVVIQNKVSRARVALDSWILHLQEGGEPGVPNTRISRPSSRGIEKPQRCIRQ